MVLRDRSRVSGEKFAQGFTLIEILVVVAIIALLVAILLPSLAAARDQALAIVCQTRLKQLYSGHIYYSQDYKGFFPHYEWWLWDAHPTSWSSPENLGWYTGGHIYDNNNGNWWSDSSRWVEYGHIYKYLKSKEVYFCPKDKMRRVGDKSIGGGTYGTKPMSSYTRMLETHFLAFGHDTGQAWANSQTPDAVPSDFLSIDRIKNANLAKQAPLGLTQIASALGNPLSFTSKTFTTTPDRVALLFEEWPNGEEDYLGSTDPGFNSTQYVSMDNATSLPIASDLFAMRHMRRASILYWDGHVSLTRKGAEPNNHGNYYAATVMFGASK